MANIAMTEGEHQVTEESFSPNIVLAWLNAEIVLTNKRLVGKNPNTLFGVIPVGEDNINQPLKNVSNVRVSTNFRVLRLIVGIVFLLGGLSTIGSSVIAGMILLIIGAVLTLTSWLAELVVTDTSGRNNPISVSGLEKDRLSALADEINSSLTY